MFKRIFIFVYLIVNLTVVYAQSTRFSLDVGAGVPVAITNFSPGLSLFGGAGIRYNLTRAISIAGSVHAGKMSGKKNAVQGQDLHDDPSSSYTDFSSNFVQYTGTVNLNLKSVFNFESKLKRLNPYLFAGAGWVNYDAKSTRIDGRVREYNNQFFYTAFSGLAVRYYLTPQFDVVANIGIHFTQTPFLDGHPMNNGNDQYLLNAVGVSYKIGARLSKEHIEWSTHYKNFKKKEVAPEKSEPIDDNENPIILTDKSNSLRKWLWATPVRSY